MSVLEWCSDAGAAAIPFGGGASVVGGAEPDVGDGYHGVVSVDLRHLQGVLEVDGTSRAARIAAGTLGPVLEAQLKPHGLTLRHCDDEVITHYCWFADLLRWIAEVLADPRSPSRSSRSRRPCTRAPPAPPRPG